MDLEGIILNENSYSERQIPYDFTYMWNLKNKTNENRLIDTGNKQGVARREGRGRINEVGEGD